MKKVPRIKSAEVVMHGIVKLTFLDGFEGVIDLRPLLDVGPMYNFLKGPAAFKKIKVDEFGHHIFVGRHVFRLRSSHVGEDEQD